MSHQTSVPIAADATLVWAVSVDVPAWPTWTPTVKRAERLDDGPFRLGSRARLAQPGLGAMVWTVTELDEGTSFSWQARRPGLVMTARHGIEAQPDGGVVATVRLDVEGPLGRVLDALVGRKIDQAVGQEAAGLKRICEEQARPGT